MQNCVCTLKSYKFTLLLAYCSLAYGYLLAYQQECTTCNFTSVKMKEFSQLTFKAIAEFF